MTRANIIDIQIKLFLSRGIFSACDRSIKSVRHLIEEKTQGVGIFMIICILHLDLFPQWKSDYVRKDKAYPAFHADNIDP